MKSIHPQIGFVHWLENLHLPVISKELPLSHEKNVTVNTLAKEPDTILLASTLNSTTTWSLTGNSTGTIFFAFSTLPLEEGSLNSRTRSGVL